MRPVVLVPRREGQPERDELWAWCRDIWWDNLGVEIVEGHHEPSEGLFSRAVAVNRAADNAGDWDVAVVVDADTIVNHDAVHAAALLADASGRITFGFERFVALTDGMSRRVRAGYRGDWDAGTAFSFVHSASSCVAMPRALWDRIGGFDESLAGWGFDDIQLSLAAQAIGGGSHRIGGTAYHLWHPPAEACGDVDHPIYRANQARCQPYMDAGWQDPAAMEKVLRANGQWDRLA